jgi:membrane protein YdbS with pleckstrin-like domain
MIYDFTFLWPWLALAAILGGAVGWNSEAPPEWATAWRENWLKQALIALVVAVIIAWLHVFPGRVGYWWETAVLFAAAYLVGGVIGGAAKAYRSQA